MNYHVVSKIYHFEEQGSTIYISSRAVIRPDELEELGIVAILSLGSENELHPSERSGVTSYQCIEVDDSDGHYSRMTSILPETRLFIHQAVQSGESILVHCRAGISRSPTVVIDYLIRATAMTPRQALAHVKEQRDCVDPRPSFLRVLGVLGINDDD